MKTIRWFLVFGWLLILSSSHTTKAEPNLPEALDSPELQWETGGEIGWFGQTEVSADGIDAAQSGPVGEGLTSWISTTVDGPGRLEFDWKHESPRGFASLNFRVDTWGFSTWHYGTDWEHVIHYDIQTGKHKLTWIYSCNYNKEQDQAAGWLDRVHFFTGGVPPRIVTQPVSQTMTTEGCADFTVWVGGTEPFTYQWKHNGADLPQTNTPSLCIQDVTTEDAGTYQVVVSNDYGSVASDIVHLVVIPTYPLDLALGSNGWKWSNQCFLEPWFGQTNETFEGRPTAKSDSKTRLAMLQTDVDGPGTLTFAWRLQAETVSDSLRFWYGYGNEISCDPTTSEWQQQTVYLGNGEDSLWWLHNNLNSSLAAAWIADVKLFGGGTAPLITDQPKDSIVLEGSPARFTVKAVGTPSLHYQWRHRGQPIAGGTDEVLKLHGIMLGDAGAYNVLVSNDYGTTISQTVELNIEPTLTTPALVFTYVPPWGSKDEPLEGMVYNLNPNDYFVAVYIYIEVLNTWWTKPTFDSPCTEIKNDGSWTCDIVTGGSDEYATTIAAFVIRKPCDPTNGNPPLLDNQPYELPKELFDRAVLAKIVTRSPPYLVFSGYKWFLKSGRCGPHNNYFSHSPQNAWVDEEGRLHLKIRHNQGIWKCSEVILEDSLGYGTYRFYLDSRVDDPPDNVVVGLYTWSNNPAYSYREIDVEFSRWNEGPDANDGQFVVQPHSQKGHRYRFPMRPNLDQTLHQFTWKPGQIRFQSLAGTDPNTKNPSDVIAEYTFDHRGEVPPSGDETARINLWLINGNPPGDEKEFELVVKKFEYLPLPVVNFTDYVVFASRWLRKDCSEPNWCEQSDLNHNESVDFLDFALFAEHWLEIMQ